MHPELRIELLGGLRIERRGEPVATVTSLRLQALLAHCILHRATPVSRQHAAFLFWPESKDSQARTNFRQLLHRLVSALPEAALCLRIDRRTVCWEPTIEVELDVAALEAAWTEAELAAAEGRMSEAIAAAERAAAIYVGDLLPDCYDAWIEPHRERLKLATMSGLDRLIAWLEERREWRAALAQAHRALELDPLRESAHRAVIRLHALAGDPALSARAFATCAEILAQELDAEPSEETRALISRIREGDPTSAPKREERKAQEAPIPLVGRHEDWRRLASVWEEAAGGQPGVVLIRGEAGIGKTCLAEAFLEWTRRQGTVTATARCWAADGMLPLEPVAQWLRAPFLEPEIAALDPVWRAEAARVLPELATAERGGEAPPTTSGGAEGRLRLFEALARAAIRPDRALLLMLDDVHWCDGDTLEWLQYLLRSRPGAPFMLLATQRSGEPASDSRLHRWLLHLGESDALVEIDLQPLDAQDAAALATALCGRSIGDAEAHALFAETEGNPLFLVEFLRGWRGVAGGSTVAPPTLPEGPRLDLPSRVRAVIRGRLGLLSPEASEVIGLLAVIGRDFTFDVVRLAAPGGLEPIVQALDELVRRHLVREHGDGALDFSHDKIREVAYSELTTPRKRVLHERVARALETASDTAPEAVAGEIARHLECAGLHEDAISWRRRAAAHALSLYANHEAAEHLGRALDLLRAQPESRERIEEEIDLETARGVPLVLMDHYTGDRGWTAYSRARDLCERIGRPVGPPVLRALALHNLSRSRLEHAGRLAHQLMEAVGSEEDPMLRVEAHYLMGVTRYWRGDFIGSRDHLTRALELYQPDRAGAHLQLFAQDPGIVCSIRLGLAEWHLGAGERAHRRCVAALERAGSLEHPFSLGYARCFASWVFVESGDLAAARQEIAAMRREREPGLRTWWAMAGVVEGYLVAEAGNPVDGLARLQEAISAYEAGGSALGTPYHQGLLARVLRRGGRLDEALAAVDAGLTAGKRTGERFWDGELHRMRGELARESGAAPEMVAASFRRARDVAAGQGAHALIRRIESAGITPG